MIASQIAPPSTTVDGRAIWLPIIGLLNSGLAAAYYLRLALAAAQPGASKNADASAPVPQVGIAVGAALLLAFGATLWLGIRPNKVLSGADAGAYTLEAPTLPAGAAGISAVQEPKP